MVSFRRFLSEQLGDLPTCCVQLEPASVSFEPKVALPTVTIAVANSHSIRDEDFEGLTLNNEPTPLLSAFLNAIVMVACERRLNWHFLAVPIGAVPTGPQGDLRVTATEPTVRLCAVLISGARPMALPTPMGQLGHSPAFHLAVVQPGSELDRALEGLHGRPESLMRLLRAFWQNCDWRDRLSLKGSELHCHVSQTDMEETVLVSGPSAILDMALDQAHHLEGEEGGTA